MTAIESKIQEIVEPIINNLGYQIYDIIYEKEEKDNYLRIFLDGENITVEDCEKVNNAINDILDEKDYIKSQYFLEVSSPGLERRIRDDKQLERFKNSKIEVHLYKAVKKEKILIGILKRFDEKNVYIELNNDEIIIEKNNISKMKNVYNWEEE